jgi:hypothetical protein
MLKVVTFSKATILERKKGVQRDPDIDAKYRDIFKLDCFQSNYTIPLNKLLKNKDDNARRYKTSLPPSHIMINNKSIAKRLTSILNVLNEANYEKQAHKVFFLMKDDDIIQMTRLILDTCTIQVFYITLFIKLLNDLLRTEHKVKVQNTIDQFVAEFWNGQSAGFTAPKGEFTTYDLFCLKQKHKAIYTARAKVVFHLLKKQMVKYDAEGLIEFIKRHFHNIDQDDEDAIDIMLQVMVDAKNILRWNPRDTGIDFSTYITNFKTKFLFETLMSNPVIR